MKKKLVLRLKKILYYNFNLFKVRERNAIDTVKSITDKREMVFENSPVLVGIIAEKWHLHSYYIKACNELKISYKVIDLFSYNWLENIREAKVDFLLARPSVQYSPWKDMFDNRLRILSESENIAIKIFPNTKALWIWESKLRTLEWLKVNNIPHPKSDVFYRKEEIFEYQKQHTYPVVYKSSSGSGSSGVKIVKNEYDLKNVLRKAFRKGIRTYRKHVLDKEHGFIILQQYLEDVKEWRIIRTGDYYVGYEKLKMGEFHSGSQNFGYGMPPEACLNLVKEITDKHQFHFVDIDVFLTKEGTFLINEIQPYFGQKDDRELLRINDESGALRFNESKGAWEFEKGKFCKNNMANLRLKEILKTLGE